MRMKTRPLASCVPSAATSQARIAGGGVPIDLPKRCADVWIGGYRRSRLFMVASRSLYALWVGTSGLEGEASGCEEGNDAIRVGYWFDSAGTSAFAGCGHAAMKTLGSYVP